MPFVAQLLLAAIALFHPTVAQGCGGMRQMPCVDADGNPFCTFEPAGINGNGVCVTCGNNGRPLCLSAPLSCGNNGRPLCLSAHLDTPLILLELLLPLLLVLPLLLLLLELLLLQAFRPRCLLTCLLYTSPSPRD